MPDFFSPFRWRMIAQLSNAFEVRTVDLLSDAERSPTSDVRLVAVHYPNIWTPAVFQAAQSPTARVFLGFSRFPAARSVVAADGGATVDGTISGLPQTPRRILASVRRISSQRPFNSVRTARSFTNASASTRGSP